MRKTILILSLVASCYLIHKGIMYWNERKSLEIRNFKLQKDIAQINASIKELKTLDDQPLRKLEDSYKHINTKISLFARSHNLKTTIDFIKTNKRGLFSDLEEYSHWVGVKQMTLNIKFYELKEISQYMSVIGFLDTLNLQIVLRW